MSRKPSTAIPTRSRWPVFFSALALLWVVNNYTSGGDRALLVVTALCAIIATAVPRPLLRTTRAVIWTGVVLGVIAFSANLSRIVPPEELDLYRAYQYDRMVTVALIPALTALFVRPNRTTVTLVLIACLSMLMISLARMDPAAVERWRPHLTLWVGLLLPFLASQAQRLTRPRPVDAVPPGGFEWVVRLFAPVLLLVVAGLMMMPVSTFTHAALDWTYSRWDGLHRSGPMSSDAVQRLSLRAPPGGFEGRIRPLVSIEAADAPGYLREAAYVLFSAGEWRLQPDPEPRDLPSMPISNASESDRIHYRVASFGVGREDAASAIHALPKDTRKLRIEVLPGYRGSGVYLPMDTVALASKPDVNPVTDRDAIVTREEEGSITYSAWITRGGGVVDSMPWPAAIRDVSVGATEEAQDAVAPAPDINGYPWLGAPDDPAYLTVPDARASAVSNWVAECTGLVDAATPTEAMAAVVRYFHANFDYALEGPGGGGDLLNAFMEERRGHCTLFATAATFMLRTRGIPARVVGGYVCHERHPLTGRWVARERDGHAWCEAWDASAGRWRLVEATPPGGVPDAFPRPGMARLAWETLAGYWRSFTSWLRSQNPLVALASVGITLYYGIEAFLRTPLGVSMILLAAFAGVAFWWRRRRAQGNEEERLRKRLIRAMARVERRMAPSTMRRRADESWTDWQQRVSDHLQPRQSVILHCLLDEYQSLRYRPRLDKIAAQAWLSKEKGPCGQTGGNHCQKGC